MIEQMPETNKSDLEIAIESFPNEFTLRCFKDKRFRINREASFSDKNHDINLVIEVLGSDGEWSHFSRLGQHELGREIVWKWTRSERLEPHGLRVFWSETLGKIAIADNSGSYPQTTEDGVQWIDFSKPIEITRFGGTPIAAIIPTTSGFYTCAGIISAMKMKELFPHAKFEIDRELIQEAIFISELIKDKE